MGIYGEDGLRALRDSIEGEVMKLDNRTIGQLGLRDCQGMWDRLDRYNVKRRRRSTTPGRKSVASRKAEPCQAVEMRTWVADGFTERAGKHIAKVIKAATRSDALRLGKVWAERHNVEMDRFSVRLAVMG